MNEDIPTDKSYVNPNKTIDGLRECYRCKEYKDLSEFGLMKSPNRRTYYRAGCKSCDNRAAKIYQAKNKEKMKLTKRNTHLKSKYGITLDEYNHMLEAQGGTCAICDATEANSGDRYANLAVDHDHETNSIRGLLCNKCNRGLGLFGDDPNQLRKAIQYLDNYKKE